MMSNFLPLLAERVIGRPLLIAPSLAEVVVSTLQGRIGGLAGGGSLPPASPAASQFTGTRRRPNGYAMTRAAGSTALISVIGALVNRGAWLDANCGMTSYEGIAAQVKEASADDSISSIILDIDSSGGEATGMFKLAAEIREVRKTKYVVAVVNDIAASAAYGIASAADEIVISPTSIVGSIGVVMLHLDRSAEMESKGVRPTLIHAGAHKIDGHPFGPLAEGVAAELQRDANKFYASFLEAVALGRGPRLSAAAARATEARTFIGSDAVAVGLADRMASLDEILAALAARKSKTSPSPTKKGKTMLPSSEADPATISAARAEERGRIRAIVQSNEAQGRETVAMNLALSTEMPVAEALASLASMPFAAVSAPLVSPAQRAAGQIEIGASGQGDAPNAEVVKAGWKNAFAKVSPSLRIG